jgi:hypothetical protein
MVGYGVAGLVIDGPVDRRDEEDSGDYNQRMMRLGSAYGALCAGGGQVAAGLVALAVSVPLGRR